MYFFFFPRQAICDIPVFSYLCLCKGLVDETPRSQGHMKFWWDIFFQGWEDRTFHPKVPLLLKLGHPSLSAHTATTAAHAWSLDLLVRTNSWCEKCPSSSDQGPSQPPAGSQQVCWMHICLPRTCWAVTCPGWNKHWRKASPSWDWLLLQGRICAVLSSRVGGEERKCLFTKRNIQRRPSASENLCCSLHRWLWRCPTLSCCPCAAVPRSLQCTPGFVCRRDVPADENVVAPSLGTRDTQASALLCKGEFHWVFMLEEGKAIIFPITFNKI